MNSEEVVQPTVRISVLENGMRFLGKYGNHMRSEFRGFHSGVVENTFLLGCDAASLHVRFQACLRNVRNRLASDAASHSRRMESPQPRTKLKSSEAGIRLVTKRQQHTRLRPSV
jgi:hypothetical protein